MKITLPYPISANRYWRWSKRGVFVSAEAKAYKEEARFHAWLQGAKCTDKKISMRITLVPRTKRSIDLDNALKIALDALQGVCYWNDSQVEKIHIERAAADKKNARLEIEVLEI